MKKIIDFLKEWNDSPADFMVHALIGSAVVLILGTITTVMGV